MDIQRQIRTPVPIGVTPLYQPFTMVLVDNEGLESDPVDLKVSVTAVNDIPTSTGNSALSATNKNTPVTITHAMLFTALPFADNDFAPAKPHGGRYLLPH